MKKNRKQRKTGMLPGTLIHTGKQKMDSIEMTVIQYSEEKQRKSNYRHEDSSKSDWKEGVNWINIDGLHDIEQIKKIGETFDLHHLLLEDVLSVGQRSKVEFYENCAFMSIKMFNLNPDLTFDSEQVSLILTQNTLISFQEKKGDVFDGIRTNIEENLGRVRKKHADFLLYRVLDVIVDNYFLILDSFDEQINQLEEQLDKNDINNLDKIIRDIKKQVSVFRKDIRPVLESSLRLLKDDLNIFEDATKTYLNDVHDHLSQIIDELDLQRESLTSLTDQYHAHQGMKLNKVMKVLTIVSTIFIPLTFIVGIYGMNFKYMPELSWENGYFLTLGVMLSITIFMILLFRYKKWW